MFYNQLLEIIEEETLRNINMYSEFLENASHTVTIEYMRRYISDKIYDTPYGDSVPLIAACGIKRNIFIVEKIGNGYDVQERRLKRRNTLGGLEISIRRK